ncbi:aminoglycoside phosphotransferase family protein [Arthrobacter roseus]
MHDDELHLDDDMVRQLIVEQFPEWRREPVRRIATEGTVNAIFRIGDDFAARLPLRGGNPDQVLTDVRREAAAQGELALCCPFPVTEPVAIGRPAAMYPLPWSVQTWLPGEVATPTGLAGSTKFVEDLVVLISTFRAADTGGRHFSGPGRGGRLSDSDEWMELCFRESAGLLDVGLLRGLWARFRALPPAGSDVMTHGDLIPGNLLISGERLVGILDGGGFGAADPALDLVAAWHLLDAGARSKLRAGLNCSVVEWLPGAAWAFQQAMGLVWYYRDSNPGMSALGRSTLDRLTSDPEILALCEGLR